jgi:hypothetical protein
VWDSGQSALPFFPVSDLGQMKAKLNTLGGSGFVTSAPGDEYHRDLVYDSVHDYKHSESLTVAVTTTRLSGRIHQHR